MVMKMDTRFKRKRHLNITFTSVSVVKSLYLTIFLSPCFLTCLFLWISKYDNETNMMLSQSQSQGHLSNRKMKAPLFSFGLAGTVTVDPLIHSNFKKELTNWSTGDVGLGGGGEATSTAVGDFVTDFDISIDEAELNLDLDIISAEQKQKKLKSNERRLQDEDRENFLNRDLGLAEVTMRTRTASSSSKTNKPPTAHEILDLDVDGGIQQAVDHYEERQNLVHSYCKSNPVFNVGRHRLSLDMFHLLNGKTNMWVRSSTNFPFPRFSNGNSNSSIETMDINTFSHRTTTSSRKVNLEWCPIFKAASTPWMALLMRLKNHLYPRTEDLIRNGKLTFVKLARLFHMQIEKPSHTFAYLSPTSQLKKTAITNSSIFNLNIAMLIVRHPFERLLSAYKDKLERIQGRLYYHRKYGIPIVQKYRYRHQRPSQYKNQQDQPADQRMRIHRRSINSNNPTDARGLPTTTRTLLVEAMRNDVHMSKFQDWQNSFAVPLLTMRMNENVQESQLNRDDETLMDLNLDSSSNSGNRLTSASFFNRFQRAPGPGFKDRVTPPDLIPTFNEFVQYLLRLSPLAMDEHWRPIFVDCNACNGPRDRIRGEGGNIISPFNLILKVETMDQDRDFLLNLLGVNQTLKADLDLVWKRWTNPSHNNTNNGKEGSEPRLLTSSTPNENDVDVGNGSSYDNYNHNHNRNSNSHNNMRSLKKNFKYFSQVSKEDLKALYLMYEPDFQMFGYSVNEYIAMGK